MKVETLFEIFYNYGWFAVIFVIVLLLLYKFVSTNYTRWTTSKPTIDELPDKSENSLKYHPFFSNAEYRLEVEISNMELIPDKPIRDRICRDLLEITVRNIYTICNEIANDTSLDDWSNEKWTDEITQKINLIAINTEIEAERYDIPDVVIRKFSKWNSKTIESLKDYVLMLGQSKLYSTNVAKTNTLLFIMNLLLVTTLGDAERTLREINGELTGLIYKGNTIE